MNKRFIISSVVMTVAALLEGFVVHAVLLAGDYAKLPNIFRGDADSEAHMPFMLAAHVLIGIGLTWIYRMGREASKPVVGQGLRFGAAVAVMTTIPTYMIYYAVEKLPMDLMVKQICFDTVGILVLGVLVAWVNRAE